MQKKGRDESHGNNGETDKNQTVKETESGKKVST